MSDRFMVDPIFKTATKKFNYRLLGLFFFAFLAISSALLLSLYSDQKLKALQNQQLPQWQQKLVYQQVIDKIDRLLVQMLYAQQADNFTKQHQQLLSYFQQVDVLINADENGFQPLIYQQKKLAPIAQRLAINSQRNAKYQQQVLVLINQLLTDLPRYISQQTQRQQQLYQQIIQDRLADSVTISRAKAYAKLSYDLQQVILLKQNLQQLRFLLPRLMLTTTEPTFAHISTLVNSTFSSLDRLEVDDAIKQPLLLLKALWLDETNLLAKWRGQLRLAGQYREKLLMWQNYFSQPVQLSIQNVTDNKVVLVVNAIQHYIPSFNEQALVYSIWGALVLFCLLFIMNLFSLLNSVKTARKQFVSNIQNALSTNCQHQLVKEENAVLLVDDSNKPQDIVVEITQLKQHEQAYQQQHAMVLALTHQLSLIAKYAQVCIWQYPWSKLSDHQFTLLTQLLVLTDKKKYTAKSIIWRTVFSREQRRQLITKAKLARTLATEQKIVLTTVQNITLEITITYQVEKRCFLGVVSNIEQQQQLTDALALLKDKWLRFQQYFVLYQKQQQDDLYKLSNEILVKSQLFSLQSENDISIYYHLISLVNERVISQMQSWYWLATKYELTELQQQCRLHLSDINLAKEHVAIVANIQRLAKPKAHQVYFILQKEIASFVTVDKALYHQLFTLLANLLWEKQYKKQLKITLKLQDKNIGQQVIGIKFKLYNQQSSVAEQLKILLNEEVSHELLSHDMLLLKSLFLRLQVSNVVIKNDEASLSVQFNIAMALSKEQQIKALPHFNQQYFIVLGTQKIVIKTLKQMITSTNGIVIEQKTSAEFIQGYQRKEFSKQKIAAVIYVAPPDCTEITVLNDYLKNLPTKLQPKLMVLQEGFLANLAQQGFFSEYYNYLTPASILTPLYELLHHKKLTNQLVSQQNCALSHYQTSQVEVLVAIYTEAALNYLPRLLTWLGLQVKVVTSANSMLTHWRTGRYLILFSEFAHSPFIHLAVGKAVVRGVFFLNKSLIDNTPIEQKLIQHWQVNTIQNIYNINTLTQLLLPWLKNKAHKNTNTLAVRETTKRTVVESTVRNSPINMVQYTHNQGSAELAAMMLVSYIDEMQNLVKTLANSISKQQFNQANTVLNSLLLHSKIIAAQVLEADLHTLKKALKEKQLKQQKNLLAHIQQQLELLANFAESL